MAWSRIFELRWTCPQCRTEQIWRPAHNLDAAVECEGCHAVWRLDRERLTRWNQRLLFGIFAVETVCLVMLVSFLEMGAVLLSLAVLIMPLLLVIAIVYGRRSFWGINRLEKVRRPPGLDAQR